MTERPRKPNMHDVARLAGVSQRTVSNVVRGEQCVASTTRERVQRAIDRLGYRPNVAAQRLRAGRTGIIALAVPDITWPYFSGVAQEVHKEAKARGLTLVSVETRGSADHEREVLEELRSDIIEGLILSPIELSGKQLLELGLDIPLVLLGEQIHGVGVPHYSVDNVAAARDMLRHLYDQGARSFWVLGSSQTTATLSAGPMRVKGVLQEGELLGLPRQAFRQVPASPWTQDEGYEAVRATLGSGSDTLPDAIIALNDLLAFGALRALWESGYQVPEHVLLSGWDDISLTEFTIPSITTISADTRRIAALAVDSLQRQIRGQAVDTVEVTVPHRIIVRESSVNPQQESSEVRLRADAQGPRT